MKPHYLWSLFSTKMIFCLLVFGCEPTQVQPPPQVSQQIDIDLSKINNNYLSFAEYEDTVFIGGSYQGDRLVFKDVPKIVMVFVNCSIQSTHAEDALVFADRIDGLELWAQELNISGGGITFWNVVRNATLYGGRITDTHTGIRATGDLPHQNIIIAGWTITNASHEGIYLGVSRDTDTDTYGFFVNNNWISNCGWDGIQIGNCRYANVSGNMVENCGYIGEYGQDYGVTINPGSLVYINDNTIKDCKKPIQVLDSRAFFHSPDAR